MGTRAILQKGRTQVGLVLPADAQAKVNQVADKSTLAKWGEGGTGAEPNLVKEPPSTAGLKPTTAPVTTPGPTEQQGVEAGEKTGEEIAGTPDNLTEIEGVGEATEQKLYAAGFLTYEVLAAADKDELAAIPGVSEDLAKEVIRQSKKLAKKKAK